MKLLALISLLGSLAVLANAYLIFSPSSLTLTSDLTGGLVSVRLAAPPPRTVAVYFDAPKTRFDRCSLVFTPNNWATPQVLRVVSEPYATLAVAERQVPITFQAYSEDCNWTHNGRTVSFPTRRDPGCAGRCAVTGDPHFDMFDLRGTYHYQGTGDFYYVRSDILTIQGRQQPCWGSPTCVVALGIRYGSAVFIIDGTRTDINQIVQAVTHTNGVTISRSRSGSVATVNLSFNSGSSLKVDIVQGSPIYSNVYINLGTYLRGRTAGLCGTFDNNGANDFTASSGQVFNHNQVIGESNGDPANRHNFGRSPNLRAFGESWRVPDSDNIFRGVRTANKLPLDVTINQCLRPDPSSVKCTWADPEACLDNWQNSWAFVQQGARLRRSVIAGATTNSTCGRSSAVVPDAIVVPAIPSGFSSQDQVPRFDGKPPEAQAESKPPVVLTEAQQAKLEEMRGVFANLCQDKVGVFEGCAESPDTHVDKCKLDIMLGKMHPKAAWDAYYKSYADVCSNQLCSRVGEPDADKERELVKSYSFCNTSCDSNCKQCNHIGCIECKQSAFEVRTGQCMARSPDEPKIDPALFGPEPSSKLLSRNEVAQVAPANQQDLSLNTAALVTVQLGLPPTSLT